MIGKMKYLLLLIALTLLSGCGMRTVEELYTPPKRSAEYEELQSAIDFALSDLEYCAPLTGEHQQSVQMTDLDGDGQAEYLLFARGASDTPLCILIFVPTESGYVLRQSLECSGMAFEAVEYVDIDGKPGMELVVGCRVSDQIPRSLAVYSFAGGNVRQLMTANYSKFVSCDLDENDLSELMVIIPGASESAQASAVLCSWNGSDMVRSDEVGMSGTAEDIKRIMVGSLTGGVPGVYVASSAAGSSIITDIFAMRDGSFTNVSISGESGTSAQTLRNDCVYAQDIDGDGVIELPHLMDRIGVGGSSTTDGHVICWYAMDVQGQTRDKMYTFHNIADGWYLQLADEWAKNTTVRHKNDAFVFSVWDGARTRKETIYSVYVLTGPDREKEAARTGRFLLYRGDDVLYAGKLGSAAGEYDITSGSLTDSFQLIFQDWKTGETE